MYPHNLMASPRHTDMLRLGLCGKFTSENTRILYMTMRWYFKERMRLATLRISRVLKKLANPTCLEDHWNLAVTYACMYVWTSVKVDRY
jgi:uncharacterized membrane protein (GlpM family)